MDMDGSNNMNRRVSDDFNSNPVPMEEEQFMSSEGFQGATSALDWDALATHGNTAGSKQAALSKWERDSLYVKFDPLVNSRPSVIGPSANSFMFKAPLPMRPLPIPAVPLFSNANTTPNKNNSSFEFDAAFDTPTKTNLDNSPKPNKLGSPNGNTCQSPTNYQFDISVGDGDAERSFASAMEASAVLESLDDVEEAVLRGKSPEPVEYSPFSPVKTDAAGAASDNYRSPSSTSPAPKQTSPLNQSGLCAAFFGQANLNLKSPSPSTKSTGSPQAEKMEEAKISPLPPSSTPSICGSGLLEPTLVSRLAHLEEAVSTPNTSLTDFVNMLDPFKPSPARVSPPIDTADSSHTSHKSCVSPLIDTANNSHTSQKSSVSPLIDADSNHTSQKSCFSPPIDAADSSISDLLQRMSLESTFVESFESSGLSVPASSPATVVSANCSGSGGEEQVSEVDQRRVEEEKRHQAEVDEEVEEQLEKMRRIARLKERIAKQVTELEAKEEEFEKQAIEDQKVLEEIRSQAKQKQEEYEEALRTKERVILERDTARNDVQTAETGFAEILMMYENMKGLQVKLEKNHEILLIREQDFQTGLTRRDARDEAARRKLSRVIEAMHTDFENKVRDRENENVKLRARHRMSEMKTQQLESAIHQVDRENEKLRVLCDELVNC